MSLKGGARKGCLGRCPLANLGATDLETDGELARKEGIIGKPFISALHWSYGVFASPTAFERFGVQSSHSFLGGSLFPGLAALGGPRVARGITRGRRRVIPWDLARLKALFPRFPTVPHMVGSIGHCMGALGVPLGPTGTPWEGDDISFVVRRRHKFCG